MRKFKFKFDALEKVRKINTELQMKELSIALKKQERIEAEIRVLENQVHEEVRRVKSLVELGQNDQMGELSIHFRDQLTRRIAGKRRELMVAKQDVIRERRKLIEKSKDQKAIEKLKEKEREKYHEEIRKADLKEMDETASSLWLYKRLL